MTLSSRAAHRISLIAGLGIAALSAWSAMQPALVVCGGLAKSYAPVIAFELARSVADLQAIFGPAAGACRAALAARMDALTWADSLVFIPVYGAFLIFFFLGLRSQDRGLARAGLAIVVAALAADYVENICLLHLSANPDVASSWLALLPWATGIKWMALAIAGAIGGFIVAQRGRIYYLAAALCAFGLTLTALAIFNPHAFGANASNGILASWIAFLIDDVRESFRRA